MDNPALADFDDSGYDVGGHLRTNCDPISWSIDSEYGATVSEGYVYFGSFGEWLTITASCNPYADFSLLALQGWIQYHDSESDEWQNITDDTVTIQVGEEVNLQSFVRPMSELVEDSWEIEGDRVANYITTAPEGKKEDVNGALTFYWYKAGTYKVTYVLKINSFDQKVIRKSATFEVTKPGAAIAEPVTDHMRRYVISEPIRRLAFTFGRNDGTDASVNGITLVAQPSGESDGEFNWFNMIETLYFKVERSEGEPEEDSAQNAYDGNAFPYARTEDDGLKFPDTPGVAVVEFDNNPLQSIQCSGSFTAYFIFRSSKPDSIWVPIKRASWFYNGELKRDAQGVLQIILDDHSTPATVDIEDEEELREWDHNESPPF